VEKAKCLTLSPVSLSIASQTHNGAEVHAATTSPTEKVSAVPLGTTMGANKRRSGRGDRQLSGSVSPKLWPAETLGIRCHSVRKLHYNIKRIL
jgi:hypothetical protein